MMPRMRPLPVFPRRIHGAGRFLAQALTVLATAWIPLPAGIQGAAPKDRRPNVIFILTDDQNDDTIGCFGGKVLTPTIDRLARDGIRFTRAYTASSVCTPSRYICLTGQYASRCQSEQFTKSFPPGTQTNVGFNVQVTPGSLNVGRVLQSAGYATGLVGKWHTGTPRIVPSPRDASLADPEIVKILMENQRRLSEYIRGAGFDYAESLYRGNLADHKLDALKYHNQEWVTQGALEFIEKYKDRPFYLQIATTLQHSPPPNQSIHADPRMTPVGLLPEPLNVQAPRASIAPRLKQAGIAENMGHATWLDDGIAAILKKLEALGIADDTAIIFFSDNATKGGKGTCYEGGARTPALMYWKGRVPGGQVSNQLVENIDFVPTILDICGVQPPKEMHLDGTSLLPLATGRQTKWRDAVFLEIGHSRGVCTQKWKYFALRYPPAMQEAIRNGTLGRPPYHMDTSFDLQITAMKRHPGYFDADQLYDLENDPDEQVNLAKDPKYAKVVDQMKARLREYLATFPHPFGEFTK